jgi:hypothetical protein
MTQAELFNYLRQRVNGVKWRTLLNYYAPYYGPSQTLSKMLKRASVYGDIWKTKDNIVITTKPAKNEIKIKYKP